AFALPRAEGMGGGDGGLAPANPPIQTSAGRLNWRVLEIGLAVCVVAFGLAAWYARRRHNA
ncbi:MAG TPA: hypothetical protein VLS48_00430, partial [Anaerolineales bacterium]|nr:hypothetical protein [Anaerolineales bacterium]